MVKLLTHLVRVSGRSSQMQTTPPQPKLWASLCVASSKVNAQGDEEHMATKVFL